MANLTLSSIIFSKLMNGKIINKHDINNASEEVVNPLFTEIMDNIKEYSQQYEMSGLDFIVNPDFIYINDSDILSEKKTPIAMKAMILLLIIGRYINENKYSPNKIYCAKTGGLFEEDFIKMEKSLFVSEILERAGITKDGDRSLFDKVLNILVHRHIMVERPTAKSYVLTDAGKSFYNDVMDGFDVVSLVSNTEEVFETVTPD